MGKKKQKNKDINPLLTKGIKLRNVVEVIISRFNISVNVFDENNESLGEYTKNNLYYVNDLNSYDDCKIVSMNIDWANKAINVFIDTKIKIEYSEYEGISDIEFYTKSAIIDFLYGNNEKIIWKVIVYSKEIREYDYTSKDSGQYFMSLNIDFDRKAVILEDESAI